MLLTSTIQFCRQPARSRYGARGRRLPKRIAQPSKDAITPPVGQPLASTSPALLHGAPMDAANLAPGGAAPGQRLCPMPHRSPTGTNGDAARLLPGRASTAAAEDFGPCAGVVKPAASPGRHIMMQQLSLTILHGKQFLEACMGLPSTFHGRPNQLYRALRESCQKLSLQFCIW